MTSPFLFDHLKYNRVIYPLQIHLLETMFGLHVPTIIFFELSSNDFKRSFRETFRDVCFRGIFGCRGSSLVKITSKEELCFWAANGRSSIGMLVILLMVQFLNLIV